MSALNVPPSSWAIVRSNVHVNDWRWVPRLRVLQAEFDLPRSQQKYRTIKEYVEMFEAKNEQALQENVRNAP
jgi:hypothetical protein